MNGKAAIFSEDGGIISHRRCRLNIALAIAGGDEYILNFLFAISFSSSLTLII